VHKIPADRETGPLGRGERLRGPLVDLIFGADIDHSSTAVGQPYEVVRRVPSSLFAIAPAVTSLR
jgi:hypothetical protein